MQYNDLCNIHFPNAFDLAIGAKPGKRLKPAPDAVEEVLSTLGVNKEHAVYIGDSHVDLETAKNAGLPCISVLWGFRDRDFLLAHGAKTLVETPEALLSVLISGGN